MSRNKKKQRRKAHREKAAAAAVKTLRVMALVSGQRTQPRVIRRNGYVTHVVIWLGDQTIAWRPHSGIGPVNQP